MSIVVAMVKIFVAMALGVYLRKSKKIDDNTSDQLSALIVNITLPILIIYSVCDAGGGNVTEVLKLFGAGVILYLLLPIIAIIFVKVFRIGREKSGAYELMLIFGNISFMGIPVVQGMYGDIAVFYNSLVHMMFNIGIFTYGIYLITRGRGGSQISLKTIISPGTISCIIAMVIYFARVPVPYVVSESLGFIGGLTTPLSMIVLGYILSGYPIMDMVKEKKIYLLAVVKLLALPLLTFIVSRQIFRDEIMVGVITLTAGMPSASLCVMLSQQYKGDTKLMSIGVFVTTVLSLITIPVISLLI